MSLEYLNLLNTAPGESQSSNCFTIIPFDATSFSGGSISFPIVLSLSPTYDCLLCYLVINPTNPTANLCIFDGCVRLHTIESSGDTSNNLIKNKQVLLSSNNLLFHDALCDGTVLLYFTGCSITPNTNCLLQDF